MCRAFPGSEYYGASVPPAAISRRRACPSLTRLARGGGGHGRFPRSPSAVRPVRHPALPRRPRHGYAADLHRDPGTAETCDTGSGPATIPDRLAARRPISARFEPVRRLQDFTRWFLSYTFRSCLPDPGRLAVPARSGVVRAAPALPGVPRIRLPSASARLPRQSGDEGLSPPYGQIAPRGAPGPPRRCSAATAPAPAAPVPAGPTIASWKTARSRTLQAGAPWLLGLMLVIAPTSPRERRHGRILTDCRVPGTATVAPWRRGAGAWPQVTRPGVRRLPDPVTVRNEATLVVARARVFGSGRGRRRW
jgi:hypothetical protein